MPVSKFCCCCVPLSIGGVSIGGVILISAIIEIIYAFTKIGLLLYDETAKVRDDQRKEAIFYLIATFEILLLSIVIAINLICIIAAILLIMGTVNRNGVYILAYLIIEAIYIIILAIIWIYVYVSLFTAFDIIAYFLLYTIFCAINVYFWGRVLSLYLEIGEDE